MLVFFGTAADSAHNLNFLQLGQVSKRHVRGWWKKALIEKFDFMEFT